MLLPGVKLRAQDDVQKAMAEAAAAIMQAPQSKAKEEKPQGNLVVFSAASGAETAYPYKEKGHGMFTYFLLKKLQETKGVVTLGELSDYITTNVKRQSVVTNRKAQAPTVMVSSSMENNWKELAIK